MPSSRLSRRPSLRATGSAPCARGGALPLAVASVRPLLLLLLLLQLCGARGGLLHSAQRELSACTPHDDSDLGVATCEDWCSEPGHCSFCKCRRCSLCQRACDPSSEGDVHFEGAPLRCARRCEDQAHCGMCKCKGCEICKGHHPERACKPASSSDLPFESCQVWCQGGQHCQYCKCKVGCRRAQYCST
ncbi:hypothetical protein AB1Y20_017238 [Prymnesium parvum]|uniref:Uncharacterized protein n=1 Tax=Prymnesium parvum TaxID=97485 RepID=A0AB34I7I3_PRYPA